MHNYLPSEFLSIRTLTQGDFNGNYAMNKQLTRPFRRKESDDEEVRRYREKSSLLSEKIYTIIFVYGIGENVLNHQKKGLTPTL